MPNLKRSHCFSVAGGQFNAARLTLQWNNGGASLGVVPSLSIFPVNVESLFVSNVTHHGLFCVFSHFIIRTPPRCSDRLCLLTGSAPLVWICGLCVEFAWCTLIFYFSSLKHFSDNSAQTIQSIDDLKWFQWILKFSGILEYRAVTQVQDYPNIVRHSPIMSGCSFLVLLLQLLN